MTVSGLLLFLTVPLVGLPFVIVEVQDKTHLLFFVGNVTYYRGKHLTKA